MPLPATKIGATRFMYATFCEAVSGELGRTYYLAKAEYGSGLFAAKNLEIGQVICPYDGALLSTSQANDGRAQTHMIRLKDTDLVVDGLPMSRRLKYNRVQKRYWPEFIEDWDQGWACMANSSAGAVSNSKMIQVRDDRDHRQDSYDPLLQTALPPRITNQMNPRAYLVASKPIAAHEEILWYYNPTFQDVQVIEVEGGKR